MKSGKRMMPCSVALPLGRVMYALTVVVSCWIDDETVSKGMLTSSYLLDNALRFALVLECNEATLVWLMRCHFAPLVWIRNEANNGGFSGHLWPLYTLSMSETDRMEQHIDYYAILIKPGACVMFAPSNKQSKNRGPQLMPRTDCGQLDTCELLGSICLRNTFLQWKIQLCVHRSADLNITSKRMRCASSRRANTSIEYPMLSKTQLHVHSL